MPMPVEALHACLAEAFPDAEIVIDDLAGDGDHYRARIVSTAFEGLPRIKQHQMVYAALKGRMGGELHALALETAAPAKGRLTMRYRPFGASGGAVSSLTLSLGTDALARGVQSANDLIYGALEAGINAYRLETADPVLAEVLGQALSNVERKLLYVSLQLGAGDGRKGSARDFSAEGLTGAIDRCLHVSGLGWFDLAILEEPGEHELSQESLAALKALRATERVKYLGVSGDGEVMDAYVSTGAFDVLATPFHVNVDWRVRSRMRAAREQDMVILAYDYFPEALNTEKKAATIHQPAAKKKLFRFGTPKSERPKDDPLAGAGTFAFLHRTPHWTAEAICLAHAMTDPNVASVLIRADTADRLAMLAAVPERDMPPGLSAQIEMARVAA